MFQVSAKLIVSGKDFEPPPGLKAGPFLYRIWKEGDLVVPKATKHFADSGVSYRLIHEYQDVDWADVIMPPLAEVTMRVRSVMHNLALPTPHLSIFVETDGNDYPPLFFPRELLRLVESIDCEIDVDIVHSL